MAQKYTYIHQNKYGNYFYRYALPTWFIRKYPLHKKRIYISLLTKDFEVGSLRLQMVSLFTQKLLSQIKLRSRSNLDHININSLVRDYRDYVAHVEPFEHEDICWDNTEVAINIKKSSDTNLRLSELLKSYITNVENGVSAKTIYKMQTHIDFLIDCIGNIKVANFDKQFLRTYREKLNQRTILSKGILNDLTSQTKNDHIRSCKKLFDHALAYYDLTMINHFDNQGLYFKEMKRINVKRVPFNDDDLHRMFSSRLFTFGAFKHPYQYWIPLLALYSGCRANELCQLRTDDIIDVDGVWCISHNLSTDDKLLKTFNERLIPIHPKLIELGFLEFVNLFKQNKYQWETGYQSHRIFSGLTLDKSRGGYAKNLSRWFNGTSNTAKKRYGGFKSDVGITGSLKQMKDFHSFRHTFSTALENAGVTDNVSYQLTGHVDGKGLSSGAGKRYRHGLTVDRLYAELCKLDYGVALENVKPFFDLNGEKRCRIKVK